MRTRYTCNGPGMTGWDLRQGSCLYSNSSLFVLQPYSNSSLSCLTLYLYSYPIHICMRTGCCLWCRLYSYSYCVVGECRWPCNCRLHTNPMANGLQLHGRRNLPRNAHDNNTVAEFSAATASKSTVLLYSNKARSGCRRLGENECMYCMNSVQIKELKDVTRHPKRVPRDSTRL